MPDHRKTSALLDTTILNPTLAAVQQPHGDGNLCLSGAAVLPHLLGMMPRRGSKGAPWSGTERYPMLDSTMSACATCAVSEHAESFVFRV